MSITWLILIPSTCLTVLTASFAPPIEYAALIFCVVGGPWSGWIVTFRSRGTESIVVSAGSDRAGRASSCPSAAASSQSIAPLARLSEPISSSVCGPPAFALGKLVAELQLRALLERVGERLDLEQRSGRDRRRDGGDDDQAAEQHARQQPPAGARAGAGPLEAVVRAWTS